MKIAMIGTGVYSFALTLTIAKNCKEVVMWTENDNLQKKYLEDEVVKDLIKGKEAPLNVRMTRSYEEACDAADIIFIATSSLFVKSVAKQIKNFINDNTIIVVASKGLEENSKNFFSEIIEEELNTQNVVILSGPSFAADLADNTPLGLVLATKNMFSGQQVKKLFINSKIKIELSNDIIGTQIGGSIKNVYAIGAGICEGLKGSSSTNALFLTEVIKEMKDVIDVLGGQKNSIFLLSVIGDLILTCGSKESRNYTYGYMLGSNDATKDAFLKNNTIEGYKTLKCYYDLLNDKNISVPIINKLYDIVYLKEEPKTLIDLLINN